MQGGARLQSGRSESMLEGGCRRGGVQELGLKLRQPACLSVPERFGMRAEEDSNAKDNFQDFLEQTWRIEGDHNKGGHAMGISPSKGPKHSRWYPLRHRLTSTMCFIAKKLGVEAE